MAWTIKGAAGEPLDATARSLETLRVKGTTLRFQTLGEDTLTWSAATDDATGGGTIIPRAGQVVELWKDSTRVFRGHASAPRVGTAEIFVTVQGPWWWLDRLPLTSSLVDSTGATAERPSYVLATDYLGTSLYAIAGRAVTLGAPMRLGTFAAIYECPKMTLDEQSCASALAMLIQWCPDAVAWFDYSDTTGDATPILNIGRRGDFTQTTVAVGTDAVESLDISPRLDLEVSRCELAYVARAATTGLPAWASQASGTAATGKRQIVAVSGPEIADILPRDDFESHTVTSVGFNAVSWLALDAEFQAAAAKNGPLNTGGNHTLSDVVSFWNGSQTSIHTSQNAVGNLKAEGGSVPAGWYYLTSGAPLPEWLATAWGAFEVIVRRVHLAYEPGWLSGATKAESLLFRWCRSQSGAEAWGTTYDALNNPSGWRYCMRPFEVRGWAVPYELTAYTQYRPWDYDYLAPPAGLAENLRAAQAWVPWEGTIVTVADDCSAANLLPRRWNVSNTLSECATMDALARAIEHSVERGRTTVELGAPGRLDFGSLVARIRREPKDNIVYL
jgi:hypothetical protein